METKEIVEQLTPVFQKMADKIGSGAEFGWEVVMRQQVVDGVGFLIGALSLLVFGVLGVRWAWKSTGWDYKPALPLVTFLGAVAVIISPILLWQATARFINPEYYAIQFFLGLVK